MSRTRQNARILAAAMNDNRALPVLQPIRERIDYGALDRIAAFAAERRAEMGEEAWAALDKEWSA